MSTPLSRTLSIRIANQLSTPPETTACQKLFILLATGTFIAIASLTASLPLNLPSHQKTTAVVSPGMNNGDIAWMIVATIFGVLLGPALAYFYSNLYGRSSSLLVQVGLIMGAMITTLWIVLSFALVYGKDANEDQILGYPKYWYMFAHTVNFNEPMIGAPSIPLSIFAMFELSFAIITPTLVAAAIIDRINIYGFLAFIFIWHLTIYAPVAHIVWNYNGYLLDNEVRDFSGGIVVNMLASATIVASHFFLDRKNAPRQEPRPPTNPANVLFSAFVVWFLWFGINAGKAHQASAVAAQSVVNTIAGVTGSVFFNYLLDIIFDVASSDVSVTNAILLGLVATTPSSGFVSVGGSLVISIFVTLSTRLLRPYLLKETDNGPYSIVAVHGIGGTIAFLFTAFISYDYIFPHYALDGLTTGEQKPIRHHLALVLAFWPIAVIAVTLALYLSDLFVPLARSEQHNKSEYAPTPMGPLRTASGIEHGSVYKQQSKFDINNLETA